MLIERASPAASREIAEVLRVAFAEFEPLYTPAGSKLEPGLSRLSCQPHFGSIGPGRISFQCNEDVAGQRDAGRARRAPAAVEFTAVIGTLLGSLGAFYAVRSMRGIVPGISGMEPAAFVWVTATLLGAALIACAVPAARAASVDPMRALREE
jgi:hypothetical protein